MPRISHKKATTLSCVVIDEDHTTGLAQQVADILNEELRSNGSDGSSSITSTCTVSAAVKRLLPLVTCPLQPQDLLQRCALLHLPDVSPAPMHAAEGSVVCVATAAAACTVMWSLMLEGVGDIVQRGILKIFGGYSYRQTVEKAGGLVLLHVALQKQQQQGEEAEVASSPGLPASIDLLLCDDIGRKLVTSHMHHVINLLCSAAGQVLYCHGTRLVNSEISSTGHHILLSSIRGILSLLQHQTPSFNPDAMFQSIRSLCSAIISSHDVTQFSKNTYQAAAQLLIITYFPSSSSSSTSLTWSSSASELPQLLFELCGACVPAPQLPPLPPLPRVSSARAAASLLPSSELFAKHETGAVEQGSSSSSILAIIIVDTLALALSQSQSPDVVESVLFTLADICCRMRAHAAQGVADVMAAVALSRGPNVAVEVHAHDSVLPAPAQSYNNFRQSLDGEILKDMLLPHMLSLHKVFSQVLFAAADVCWGLVGNSNGGFVTQSCNLLRDLLTASASLTAATAAAAEAAKATPSIFGAAFAPAAERGDGADEHEEDDHLPAADEGLDQGGGGTPGDNSFATHAETFLRRVLSMPPGRKGRYIALQVLLEVFPENSSIVRACRQAFSAEIFRMSDFSTAATLGRLLLLLLAGEGTSHQPVQDDLLTQQQQQQQSSVPWWCNAIIRSLLSSSYTCRLNLANRVLPDIFADDLVHFHTFMQALPAVAASADNDFVRADNDDSLMFERVAFAKLSACVAVRDAAPNRPGCDAWKQYVDDAYVAACVRCGDADVVLRALNLISLKASAAATYTHAEIAAIQSSFVHNSKSASPSFVGSATEIFKKFLVRACALGNSTGRGGKSGGNARSRKGSRAAPASTSEGAQSTQDETHDSPYIAMCQWLGEYVPNSCYPGVAYERSCFVLSLLLTAMDVIDPFSGSSRSSCGAADKKLAALSTPEQAQHLSSVVFNPATVLALFNLLTDSHDAARDKAYSILMRVRSSVGVLDSAEDVKSLASWAVGLCSSLRVREADAGARALSALHHMCSGSPARQSLVDALLDCVSHGSGVGQPGSELEASGHVTGIDGGRNGSLEFVRVLERCISRWAHDPGTSCASVPPLQGIITLVSLVITSTNFSAVVSSSETSSKGNIEFSLWQQVLSQLATGITSIIRSSLVLLSTGIHAPPQPGVFVQQSPSEEGDSGAMTASMFGGDGEEEGEGVALEDVGVISSWVNLRSSCSLISTLVKTMAPLASYSPVDHHTWRIIGASLLTVPRSTLHNGAIDCAAAALSDICSMCLNSSHTNLLEIPALWLADPMARVLSGEAPTVRRSSAVTFAVAAVLDAEPARSNRPLLSRTLKTLFAAADDESSSSSWRSRVHARNCLRLLFNSSTLGANMLQWVEQGLLCAFSGFRSSSWSVRNSSTLLFSCLVTRALGGSSNRKTVSLSDFCAQFQGLPSALAELLSVTMKEFEDVGHSTSLQPVLVLLASLRPSSDLPPKLSECICAIRAQVERVTCCSDVLLSRMAASAFAALQPTTSAAAVWTSYITRSCAAIAHRHSHAVGATTTQSPAPSRHATLGYICTATAILDSHASSPTLADEWWSVLPPTAAAAAAVLHALAVASPSEAERLCLMLRSLSQFVDTASASKSLSPEKQESATAATASFLSAAAHILTKRCCSPPPSALVSHSIAASAFSGRAISFCLKHGALSDVRAILTGGTSSASLLKSGDVSVRRAVLKHCVDVIGARTNFSPIELLQLLIRHLSEETAPPLHRKCLNRVAEVFQSIALGRHGQQQQQQPVHDTECNHEQLRCAVAEVMSHVSSLISNAVTHASPSASQLIPSSITPPPCNVSQRTLSEKSIQAAVGAAAAAASVALTITLNAAESDSIFQHLFDAVNGSIVLSDHPDVAEACAAAVGASGVMRHNVWAAKFSICLLGLLQSDDRDASASAASAISAGHKPSHLGALVQLTQLMCNGPQVHALICQLQAQALSCSDHCSGAERVFAHEDENLSIEPVVLAQCIAHCVSVSCGTTLEALATHVRVDAMQAAGDLRRVLVEARTSSAASVTHCGGAMRHPARYAAAAAAIALVQVAVCARPSANTPELAAVLQECIHLASVASRSVARVTRMFDFEVQARDGSGNTGGAAAAAAAHSCLHASSP